MSIERTKPRFDIPSEDTFRTLLEALFAHRDLSVEQALAQADRRVFLPASAGRISGKLRKKTVCQVTPREFGDIAQRSARFPMFSLTQFIEYFVAVLAGIASTDVHATR